MRKLYLPKPHSLHVTLRDVAKQSGVSIKTVSRVVNNQGEISEATRHRVQKAIKSLGYRPNILARSLVSRKSNTLAVVAWGLDYYGPSRTVAGVEQQSNELGYSLFLNLIPNPDDPNVASILDTLAARRVDGIVWAVPEVGRNREWIRPDWLEQLPPTVFLSMRPSPGLSVVAVDNRAGAAMVTQHLFDQGRRKIGLITGPLVWWEARERYEGWRETLLRAGLNPAPSLVVEGDWSAMSGDQGLRKLLAQQPDVDAVFACNDQMALGALGAAHHLGRRVPQDVALVGFDDTPESAYFWPPLTTVHQHVVDVGRVAVQVLHSHIQSPQPGKDNAKPSTTLLTPELVVRQSSLLTLQPSSQAVAVQ
ncbi:MAG: LacI family transcriptional regulator [Chloroflexi bacterium]|nr:LacI family transcriptional regulator [Chloroflexota bacterium]MCL5951397.1 LacI family transcriptional regulator [Chloroflexota bacterium]